MAWAVWTMVCVFCLFRTSTSYRDPYATSMRDSFLRILEDSVLSNPLNPLDDLVEDAPYSVGSYNSPLNRRYEPEVERGSYNSNPWASSSSDDDEYFDRVAKGDEAERYEQQQQELLDEDYAAAAAADALTNPMTRDQEYLQHSSLWGHQYIQGGAGEGSQILKPDGGQKNSQEMKTDAVLPAYCDPPNPCPVGYTAEDGCLEDFENTAAFSREYQEAQDCLCDAEHMFGCGEPRGGGSGGSDDDEALSALLSDYKIMGQHKTLVAKKFHTKKSEEAVRKYEENLRQRAQKAAEKYSKNPAQTTNEFLAGEKLPVAAKKGMKLN